MKIEWLEKYMTEAEQLIVNNQVEQGLTILNNLLLDEPGYAELHNHLGWAYLYYSTDMNRAELHLKMAIRFDPEFAPPYLHMGALYIRANRFSEALDYLKNGVNKRNAYKVTFCENMGRAYESRGEFRSAIKAYREGALASMAGLEMNNLTEGIKRCRRKRWMMMFNF